MRRMGPPGGRDKSLVVLTPTEACFALTVVGAAGHWWWGGPARAGRLLLTLALSMYVGFVGYALFPAFGPVGAMTGLRPIGDNAATELVAAYGVALGTFPSLHAGISAAVAIDG